jgi:hypothetical protein
MATLPYSSPMGYETLQNMLLPKDVLPEDSLGLDAMNQYGGFQSKGLGGNTPGAWEWGSPQMGQAIGLGMGALQGIGGLGQVYLGMKNYGLAKQQLAQNKQQYWNNFTSQARLTNAELRDRQNGRNAAAARNGNPESTMATEEYMKLNSINEKGYN